MAREHGERRVLGQLGRWFTDLGLLGEDADAVVLEVLDDPGLRERELSKRFRGVSSEEV